MAEEKPLWTYGDDGPRPSSTSLVFCLQAPEGPARPGDFLLLLAGREIFRVKPDGSIVVLGETVATKPEVFELVTQWVRSLQAPVGEPPVVDDVGGAGPPRP